MISSSPSPRAARWSSSWTGMSCSIEPRIIRVGLMISSTPRWRKRSSFLGLLTRAIVRGTSKWCLAIWQITRLSSSSPVTAATMSARFAAGLAEVLALAAVMGDDDRADLVGDLVRPRPVLLHEDDLVAALDELLGQVVADLAAADDEHEHGSGLPPARAGLGRAVVEARSAADGPMPCGAVVAARRDDDARHARAQPRPRKSLIASACIVVRHIVAMPSSA